MWRKCSRIQNFCQERDLTFWSSWSCIQSFTQWYKCWGYSWGKCWILLLFGDPGASNWSWLVLVVRMVRTEPYMQVSHFWDLAAHPRGMHPFNPVMLGIGRDPTASSILTPHNSCDLTPPMRGTQQNWSLVWQEGPYDNHTAPRTNPHPQGGLELIIG